MVISIVTLSYAYTIKSSAQSDLSIATLDSALFFDNIIVLANMYTYKYAPSGLFQLYCTCGITTHSAIHNVTQRIKVPQKCGPFQSVQP